MSDVLTVWSVSTEYVQFLSQSRSGAVSMESRQEEGWAEEQGLYQRQKSDRVLRTYARYVLG